MIDRVMFVVATRIIFEIAIVGRQSEWGFGSMQRLHNCRLQSLLLSLQSPPSETERERSVERAATQHEGNEAVRLWRKTGRQAASACRFPRQQLVVV